MKQLPPGQKASAIFPRFGIPKYANRFPKEIAKIDFSVGGDIAEFEIRDALQLLPRIEQVSDFHCVTTWSKLDLNWSGYRFREFYETYVLPKLTTEITFVVLKAQDGYKTSLPLQYLLQDNVLLADRLDNEKLSIEHGAPIRIVAPDHYGYKNLKHIKRIEFYANPQKVKQGILSFMDHPSARVAQEERARFGPSIFFRFLYSLSIKRTIKTFERATAKYLNRQQKDK